MNTEPTQAAFVNACRAAAARLWMHRKALHRVAVRIGFWPDGMVISATISAKNDEELSASAGSPRLIPWAEVETITEDRLVAIVDELCEPLYAALEITRPS